MYGKSTVKNEKTVLFLKRHREPKWSERQAYRQAGRQAGRQTDRQTVKQAD